MVFDRQINLLCTGDILSGKTSFLEHYTNSPHQQLHYRLYPHIHAQRTMVYLHQVEEREGMDAYLTYPFDGVLYFLNIHEFHNPCWAILDQLSQISRLNGNNIFKIPLKLIVLSAKKLPYLGISQQDKKNFVKQLGGMIDESMVIFVEDDCQYRQKLGFFYRQVLFDEAPFISEGIYVKWQLKGVIGLIPFQNLMLGLKKVTQSLHRYWVKLNIKLQKKRV